MVKHTQTIRRQFADEFLIVFDHFVGLALKGLKKSCHYIETSHLIFRVNQLTDQLINLHQRLV